MKTPVILRLFSDVDGETIELFGSISGMERAEFSARFPSVAGRKYDSNRFQVAKDTAGNIRPVTRSIEFKKRKTLHKCDARCLYARGKDCECQCGGINHGRGDAGAHGDLFAEPVTIARESGFFEVEDTDARADEIASNFALEFMGGALELGAEQLSISGFIGGEAPRAIDPRQNKLF